MKAITKRRWATSTYTV